MGQGKHTRRRQKRRAELRARGAGRKGALVVVVTVVLLGAAYGVAAGVVGPGLLLSGGQTSQVTCSGRRLVVENRTSTGLDLRCIPAHAGRWEGQGNPADDSSSTTPTSDPSTTDPSPTTEASPPPTDPTPPPTYTPPPAGSWWMPPLGNQPWQWEIDHPLDLSNASDMGTGVDTYTGAPAPNPVIYDIDGIENPKSTVTALHQLGDHVICYIEVGSAGDYYSAAEEGVATTYYDQLKAAGDLGDQLSGYPEYFLNIASPTTLSIIESMIDQQCAAKGFDAVETDLDETYSGSDGTTGFTETKATEEQYMTTLANYMHSLGLGWIIKNPDDTGDSYASDMEPLADGVLTEQCNQYDTCGLLSAYQGHKAVFNAEYSLAPSAFCPADNAADFNGAQFNVNLFGGRVPCR
ncbi:MAG: endo alpha-1,4 polygalactosaminidase [Acidimicrobiales bacterium]